MEKRRARRTTRCLSNAETGRLQQHREILTRELPDLVARDQMRKKAREEASLSGELRRAIHASALSLSAIAAQAGIPPLLLDGFLTGERTLRSDVMDRLAEALGY